MYLVPCQSGHAGRVAVVEVTASGTPLTHSFASAAEAYTWLLAEHEAALSLDIIDLVPAPSA